MASPVPLPPDGSLRLADQLQTLSQVAEALTYRLLELEERMEGHESRIGEQLQQLAGLDAAQGDAVDQRLEATQAHLARIEVALRGLERSGASRLLQAMQPPARQQDGPDAGSAAQAFASGLADTVPFPEEGEQPFIEELIAS